MSLLRMLFVEVCIVRYIIMYERYLIPNNEVRYRPVAAASIM